MPLADILVLAAVAIGVALVAGGRCDSKASKPTKRSPSTTARSTAHPNRRQPWRINLHKQPRKKINP